jgi:hypothetical protein
MEKSPLSAKIAINLKSATIAGWKKFHVNPKDKAYTISSDIYLHGDQLRKIKIYANTHPYANSCASLSSGRGKKF